MQAYVARQPTQTREKHLCVPTYFAQGNLRYNDLPSDPYSLLRVGFVCACLVIRFAERT